MPALPYISCENKKENERGDGFPCRTRHSASMENRPLDVI